MAGVQLVVTDLDGTLWGTSGEVHLQTRIALDELRRGGLPVLAGTARRRNSARQAMANHEVELGAVLVDGALGYEALDGEAFLRCPLSDEAVLALVDAFARFESEPMFETDDLTDDVLRGERPSIPDAYFEHIPGLRVDLAEPLPLPVFSAVAIVGRMQARGLIAAIEGTGVGHACADLNPAFPDTAAIKATPATCSKWKAVLAYCAIAGIDTDRVLAIGDNDNDADMIANAGVGLAVATGSPAARAAADFVVSASDEGGWAELLKFL
jgi:HAD superfamily hydrolase (TIGR01484 family)